MGEVMVTRMTDDLMVPAGREAVDQVIQEIAADQSSVYDVSMGELTALKQWQRMQAKADEFKKKIAIAKVDYAADKKRFLSLCKSKHTKRAYASALNRMEAWCRDNGTDPVSLTYATADDMIISWSASGRAPGTVRLDCAAINAFFVWAERRHQGIVTNPLRGSRARPKMKPVRKLAVPTADEVKTITRACKGWLRAAVVFMAETGARVGGLPSLSISGSRWTAFSKGKENIGKISDAARDAITKAGLSMRSPFKSKTASMVQDNFRYVVEGLFSDKKIAAMYSPHDLRHFAACRIYRESLDIYKTSKILNHSDIGTTQRYLRSINALDD